MNIEDLTGKELKDIEAVTGQSMLKGLAAAEDTGNFDAAFAFVWIQRRRKDPSVTFDDVLNDTTFKAATEALMAGQEIDQGKGSSGTTSPSSAATGR